MHLLYLILMFVEDISLLLWYCPRGTRKQYHSSTHSTCSAGRSRGNWTFGTDAAVAMEEQKFLCSLALVHLGLRSFNDA